MFLSISDDSFMWRLASLPTAYKVNSFTLKCKLLKADYQLLTCNFKLQTR